MRDKQHQRNSPHQPPSHLSADGMDAWYFKLSQRERELRQRRLEAETLLRGYRGGAGVEYPNKRGPDSLTSALSHSMPEMTLHDPISFRPPLSVPRQDLSQKLSSEDEKKVDDAQTRRRANDNNEGDDSSQVPVTIWRDFISSAEGASFPPAVGRYHLYLSYACPGSHRVLIVRALKGLEHAVSVTIVHPTWRLTNPDDVNDKHRGWVFGDPHGAPFPNTIGRGGPFPAQYPGNDPDPFFDAYSIRQIYQHAADTSGKYTIPLLWDSVQQTIVNNESSDIAYMLNSCLNEFADNPDLDLYTEYDEEGMEKLNEVSAWMAPLMIHGVYRCGFAKTQRAYDKAIAELCVAFDNADDLLSRQRYLTGDEITDVDIRLFCTLLRFDEVYAFYFRANARLVMLTPSLLNFCRDVYQIPGVAGTCQMEQIKAHFFGSHAEWNKYSVIPRGLGFVELLQMPHNRAQLFGTPQPPPQQQLRNGSDDDDSLQEAEV
jgi:glutathionyl-hydroquinone reductase